jgi:hypothetical protein
MPTAAPPSRDFQGVTAMTMPRPVHTSELQIHDRKHPQVHVETLP